MLLQYALASGVPKKKILYIACDHPAMMDVNLYDLAQIFFQEGGKLLFIDEVHKAKGFAVALKAIRDHQ